MQVTQILSGLERSDVVGADADAAGRLGFLAWALVQPGAATPEAARAALAAVPQQAQSAAAQVFIGLLQQATLQVTRPVRRRRAARLH